MKRILIFSLAYLPFAGGAELAVKEITDRISSDEYEFDMITLRFDRALPWFERVGNINVHRIGFTKTHPTPEELLRFPMYLVKVLYPVFAFYKALGLHRTRHYDAFWAIMAYAGFPVMFFKLFTQGSPTSLSISSTPLILTLQEGDTIEHMTKRLRIRPFMSLYKFIFKKAAVIQAISAYLADFARTMGATCPIHIIPNGVDVQQFKNQKSKFKINSKSEIQTPGYNIKTLKLKLSIHDSDKVVITTSRLVLKNGIDTLIDAMRFLPENTKLLVLGSGPLEESFKFQISNSALGGRVQLLGNIDYKDIPHYLHTADVFCRPSRSEGMGTSFIEAMAAGVPVVATPVGGIPDFLKDGETGLFCEIDSPKSVAKKIQLLLDDSELRGRIIQNARAMVEKRHDWETIAQQMREKFFGTIFT